MCLSCLVALSALSLLLCSCSPFSGQVRSLDRDYRSGRIQPSEYYALRSQALEGDAQWRRDLSHRAALGFALGNQLGRNINDANAIGAYRERTQVFARPQQVNVNHSGTVNHNLGGTVYLQGN
jgi:hypothetical protein